MTVAVDSHPPLLVVVSIDTEEDNWQPTRDNIRVTNIRALPALQQVFDGLGVRPTYFTSYQVARVRWAADILGGFAADGRAEIGAHLHPWNTPPLSEPFEPRNTMMKNLPDALQSAKLMTLTGLLEEVFGTRPRAFRAGRYALGRNGIKLLAECGYAVDSSVTPFCDWRRYNDGPDFRGAPCDAYRPSLTDVTVAAGDAPMIDLPLSVGYTRRPFLLWSRWHERLVQARLGPFSLGSVAYRTHFLRKVQLSFETDTAADMLVLSRHLVRDGARFLHLTWHSPSMVPGFTPFVTSSADRDRFRADIDGFFEGLSKIVPFTFATVSEAAERLVPGVVPEAPVRGH